MIIDWRTMKPWIPGTAEDALGNELSKTTFRIDTETGDVWYYDNPPQVNREGTEFVVHYKRMIPPITVWLFT